MSAAVAIGHGIDVGFPSLKTLFSKTGGKMPKSDSMKGAYWPASYFVQAMAIADKLTII